MNRSVNLLSVAAAKRSLSEDTFKEFLGFHGVGLREGEIEDIQVLCGALLAGGVVVREFDNCHLGYVIGQIGKEFDIIRFDKNLLVNIELKGSSTADKISTQLRKNKYYLKFCGRDIKSFTYVADDNEFFALDSADNLRSVALGEVVEAMKGVSTQELTSIEKLFNPGDYLVSPFNSPDKFLAAKYFLTDHQERIAKEIMSRLGSGFSISSIAGRAGTGKSLLTYHIARSAREAGLRVLIIHCGVLNSGHNQLKENGFDIVPAKEIGKLDWWNYDVVVVDEAQRIWTSQLDNIIKAATEQRIACIFCHDGQQTLSSIEAGRGIVDNIRARDGVAKYELTDKIRTNAEIADFIEGLFWKYATVQAVERPNISICYFDSHREASAYWTQLDGNFWTKLRLTPSRFQEEHHEIFYSSDGETAHNVIGQEFDRVAILIDDKFAYGVDGRLIYQSPSHYDPVGMLFQNITRAKRRLKVIINNDIVWERCCKLLVPKGK